MADLVDTSELMAFAADLQASPAKVAAASSRIVDSTAEDLAAAARAEAPKGRPWLSTSEGITVENGAEPGERVVSTGLDPLGQPVGLFQEFGTSRQAPRPFLLPHVEKFAPRFNDDLGDAVGKSLR